MALPDGAEGCVTRTCWRVFTATFGVGLAALVQPPPGALAAEPEAAGPTSAPTPTDPEASERTLFEYLRQPHQHPVRSLLVEKEMPLVGIRWGADVQFDVPLNHEPEDADPTLREAKFTFYRGFGRNWSGKVTANYNDAGQLEIGDSYLVYSGAGTYNVSAGIYKPAFSLESVSKRYGLTFMERALPVDALAERRSGGVSVLKRTADSILDVGIYLFSPDQEGQREKGQGVVLHYVHAPLWPDSDISWVGRDVWAGVSFSYRHNADPDDTRFRSRPEVGITDDYFVDTGPISGADSIIRLGLEASKVAGPFSWQAELLATTVTREHQDDVAFLGGYGFASWFLTGESRNYDPATGRFLGVTPAASVGHGGWGAWELAARFSAVDLTDEDIVGGRQANLSAGINWYLNDHLRIQANLIKVLEVKRPGSEFDGLDPWIGALRLEWRTE